MRLGLLVISFISFGFAQAQTNLNTNWLQTSIAADLLYDQGLNDDNKSNNDIRLREAEAFFYAAIDPKFNGVLSFNAHNDGDDGANVEIHEAYFESSVLIKNWELKVGQYFLDLGRLNRIHRHDWSFTFAPLVYRQFFAKEGLLDTGVELGHLFGTSTIWKFTAGAVIGKSGEHSHGEEESEDEEQEVESQAPSAYFKLSAFRPHGSGGNQLSLIGYFGNNTELRNYQLTGLNYTLKRRKGNRLIHLLEVEGWGRFSGEAGSFEEDGHEHEESGHEHSEFFELTSKKQFGGYVNYAYGLNAQWSIGTRADYFQLVNADSEDYTGARAEVFNATTYLSWNHSEFFRTRLSLNGVKYYINGNYESEDYRATLQFIFLLGSHPTHDF